MYLSTLGIEGYKGFGTPFEIELGPGLNVLVGENGVGKSGIVDAIRTILQEDEFGRAGFSDGDFYRPFSSAAKPASRIIITGQFSDLSREEQVAFLPWTDINDKATLTIQVENHQTSRGRYKRMIWGGASSSSVFEWDLLDLIDCIYLPPLRDAQAKLREGRGSRLARLLKNLNHDELKRAAENQATHPLEQKVRDFNKDLAGNNTESIARANDLIRQRLQETVGKVFGQDTRIQFSEASFDRIVESLRLLFFPVFNDDTPVESFRSLDENSLGYNNLLYLATVLAELTSDSGKQQYLRLLLIEEPEAHLHPQLQVRLLKFLETKAKDDKIQIIVTTHSPVLASAVSLDSLIHLSWDSEARPLAVPVLRCGLSTESNSFVSRWLDATKSVLFFARGVILVEGVAEALLLPELAKRVLKDYNSRQTDDNRKLSESLVDAGVSVIGMNGIYFRHFMPLFCNVTEKDAASIPVRCAGITDRDPAHETLPIPSNPEQSLNPVMKYIDKINSSQFCRLYVSPLKTLEYDLAMEQANLSILLPLLLSLWPAVGGKCYRELEDLCDVDWAGVTVCAKREAAAILLKRVQDSNVGKGFFAQSLAQLLATGKGGSFAVPEYLQSAILWVVGGVDGRS